MRLVRSVASEQAATQRLAHHEVGNACEARPPGRLARIAPT
jgi:hypothetical protein